MTTKLHYGVHTTENLPVTQDALLHTRFLRRRYYNWQLKAAGYAALVLSAEVSIMDAVKRDDVDEICDLRLRLLQASRHMEDNYRPVAVCDSEDAPTPGRSLLLNLVS